jgi:hypothetical protein
MILVKRGFIINEGVSLITGKLADFSIKRIVILRE